MLDSIAVFLRFSRGLGHFFRATTTADEARALLHGSLQQAEANFLLVLREGIFGRPGSPYLPLLRHVGAAYGDIAAVVRRDGVPAALRQLRDAGVTVSIDEFKGKRPIVRGALEISAVPADFDNPLMSPDFPVLSGGTGGSRRRMNIDLALVVFEAAMQHAMLEAHGLLDRPLALWRPTPPGSSGIKHALRSARLGTPVARWFQLNPGSHRANWRWRLLLEAALWQAGRHGGVIPRPVHAPLSEPRVVAEWLGESVARGNPAMLCCPASAAVRLCEYAEASRISLRGVVFWIGGEAVTAERVAAIERAGGRTLNGWSLSETGPIAMGCAKRVHSDEVHVVESKVAVIPAEDGAESPQTLLLSTVLPSMPKILLNVDSGDRGVLHSRDCGCALHRAGFGLHLHGIRAHQKLTAGGMHILPADLEELVGRVLPGAFGGGAHHYQFVESAAAGAPRVTLHISPRVGAVDLAAVQDTVVQILRRKTHGDAMMVDHWLGSGIFCVQRAEPLVTAVGKTPAVWVLSDDAHGGRTRDLSAKR